MKEGKQQILFLAPQPFFQERGTPIAVRMAVETLAESGKYQIDLVTYHEGFDITIQNVRHIRMWAPKWLRGIRPGVSLKKLVCDFFFIFQAIKCLIKNDYEYIHAVEESVFIAIPFFCLFGKGKKLIYDMDSSLSMQLIEKWPGFGIFSCLFSYLETMVIAKSSAVLAVCDDLVMYAKKNNAKKVCPLYDVSLLDDQSESTQENLRNTIHADSASEICLYVGNLEKYQGIDLLIESFSDVVKKRANVFLVILGGSEVHIEHYTNKARTLNLEKSVYLLGPRPLSQLGAYLAQATVLVSPRIYGNNTPMKVYSYLDSNVSLVATRLPTHTQCMNDDHAILTAPIPKDFAQGIIIGLTDKDLTSKIRKNAKNLVQEKYTKEVFKMNLLNFYKNELAI